MASPSRVQNLVANSGEKAAGYLEVPGTDIRLPTTLVNGAFDGPKIGITAGVHGAEYPGIEAAIRLAGKIDPSKVKGQITIVHVSNPPAFFARSIYVNPLDGKNLNRAFPGDAEGTATDRIAHVIFTEVMQGSDFFIDLHGGDMIEKLVPFTIYSGEADAEVMEVSKAMAKAYGIPYAVASGGQGGTYGTAARAGIPSILAEAGGVGILDEESVVAHLEGLEKVLRFAGALEQGYSILGREIPDKKVEFLGAFPWLRSDTRGFLYLDVEVGDTVTKGRKVGVIKDAFGSIVKSLYAPATGIVLFRVTSPATNPNDPILAVGAE